MASNPSTVPKNGPALRRRIWAAALLMVPAAVVALLWSLTEPLQPTPSSSSTEPAPKAEAAILPESTESIPSARLAWPDGSLAGKPAKRILLDVLKDDQRRLRAMPGYTATMRKRERLRGKLGAEQTLAIKVRHEPFSIYIKYLAPKAGKEAVYVAGKHDGNVIAHNGDWTRRLIPRLKVAPSSSLALADNRHPLTEAGLLNLVNRLVGFREMDLADPDAVTVLDRVTDADGRTWLRSVHTHPVHKDERPFARVEVLYDSESLLPYQITSFDWPAAGHTGDLLLAEQYAYDDLKLGAPLADIDFDPANPEYAFTRY